MKRAIGILVVAISLGASDAQARSTFTIRNTDGAGIGFNDTTPVQPIGGNTGRTLGEQRLQSFQRAAEIWGAIVNSNVEIVVEASFAPIGDCAGNSVTLGAARAARIVANFDNAPKFETWYPVALANSLAGRDLVTDAPDIIATFNSLVDNQTCLGTSDWYYGLDAQHGEDIDLVVVLLHEFAHGLGMSSAVSLTSGSQTSNRPSIYESFTFDKTLNLLWTQMTTAQRRLSALNTSQLVWTGESVRAAAAPRLSGVTSLNISSPSAIARNYDIGTAAFGPPVNQTPLNGRIVAATDTASATGGTSTTDGCSAFTNANDVSGNIALVDRGSCDFVVKARNAQAAGAIGLIIADNSLDTCMPPSMGGSDPSITIPTISVGVNDGRLIRDALAASVSAALIIDGSSKAGASEQGFVRLFAPCSLASGSSVHHWDTAATPNLLMEPNISDDLEHEVDITVNQLVDIGWSAVLPDHPGGELAGPERPSQHPARSLVIAEESHA